MHCEMGKAVMQVRAVWDGMLCLHCEGGISEECTKVGLSMLTAVAYREWNELFRPEAVELRRFSGESLRSV